MNLDEPEHHQPRAQRAERLFLMRPWRWARALVLVVPMACSPTEVATPDEPAPIVATPASHVEVEPPSSASVRSNLRWSLPAGARWEERTVDRLLIVDHPRGGFDPEVPLSVITQTDRFEIIEATADEARLTVTPVDVQLEIREHGTRSVFRSDAPPSAVVDPLAAEKLAAANVPLELTVTPRGAVTRLYRRSERAKTILERFDALVGATPTSEQADARVLLARDLEGLEPALRERGIRPLLPSESVAVGSRWSQTMRLPSLFESTVRYELDYTLVSLEDDEARVKIEGRGVLEPSPMMATVVADSAFEIHGSLRLDPRRGVLLEHEEELRMRVELRPHPALGEGGTMASRLERTRVRVEPSGPEPAQSP